MENVVIDGKKYVPEDSATPEISVEQVCGTTITARKIDGFANSYIVVEADGEPILGIYPDQEIVLQNPAQWARMKLYNGENTKATAEALIEQWSAQLGLKAEPENIKDALIWTRRSDDWGYQYAAVEKYSPYNPNTSEEGTLVFIPNVDHKRGLYIANGKTHGEAETINRLRARVAELEAKTSPSSVTANHYSGPGHHSGNAHDFGAGINVEVDGERVLTIQENGGYYFCSPEKWAQLTDKHPEDYPFRTQPEHTTPLTTDAQIDALKPGDTLLYDGESSDKYLSQFAKGTLTVVKNDRDNQPLLLRDAEETEWWIWREALKQGHLTINMKSQPLRDWSNVKTGDKLLCTTDPKDTRPLTHSTSNWAQNAGIKKGGTYTVTNVSPSGNVRLSPTTKPYWILSDQAHLFTKIN